MPYARRDWSRALLLLREHDPNGAGMFLQQAVEKYLKGWLLDRGWPLRKIHEVHRLLDDAVTYAPALRSHGRFGERLSGYYLFGRYPASGIIGPDEAQITADLAEARQLVQILFPDETLSQ